MQACHDCYTLDFSLEKTCDVIGSVHPVRKCSNRSKADQSQSRFGTVQVNSMIVITLVSFSFLLLLQPKLQIWIAFGRGKHFQHLSVNSIYGSLGQSKAMALPMFHAITGCDTTSASQGRGKKTAWEAWDVYPDVTDPFLEVIKNPFIPLTIDYSTLAAIERFVVIMYDVAL